MRFEKASRWGLLAVTLSLAGCEGGKDPLLHPAPKETVHFGTITVSETWRAADNPHVVRGIVYVRGAGSPVLTVEPGVQVRFESESSLTIGDGVGGVGTLKAEGTAEAPILFTSDSDEPQPGDWYGITLMGSAALGASLSHVTVEYGGAPLPEFASVPEMAPYLSASLRVSELAPTTEDVRTVRVRDVVVQQSLNQGVLLSGAGFTEDSARLVVRDNAGAALSVSANNVGSLPADSRFSGNTDDVVRILTGTVQNTQTWPMVGVPYRFADLHGLGLTGVTVGAASSPVLTLSPGTEFQMPETGIVRVGAFDENGSRVPGAIHAVGTAEAPIRFVPVSATAPRGSWAGLQFMSETGSTLEHVTITHGGRPYATATGGNLTLLTPANLTLRNVTLSESSGCGLVMALPGETRFPDYTEASLQNVFTNNDSGAQCNNP